MFGLCSLGYLLNFRVLPTTSPMMQMVSSVTSQLWKGAYWVRPVKWMAKVEKDDFYKKLWRVCRCGMYVQHVFFNMCMRECAEACRASVSKWLKRDRLAPYCRQSHTLITVLTHCTNRDWNREIANHTAVMSHIRVHKCSFYTLYRASEREGKPLAVSQAVFLLLHLAKSPWRNLCLWV